MDAPDDPATGDPPAGVTGMAAGPSPGPTLRSLAALAPRLSDPTRPGGVDWTKLRAFDDWVLGNPTTAADALGPVPPPVSPLVDNLLAGVAETLAGRLGLDVPPWCAAVAPLAEPHVTPGSPRMEDRARDRAPGALAARNVFVAAEDLWS